MRARTKIQSRSWFIYNTDTKEEFEYENRKAAEEKFSHIPHGRLSRITIGWGPQIKLIEEKKE